MSWALLVGAAILQPSKAVAVGTINVIPLSAESQSVIVPATLGIVVNEDDPRSIELGRKYAAIRGVPNDNIVSLRLPRVKYIARHLFSQEYKKLTSDSRYSRLSALVLAFSEPSRVDANQSITSAFAQGLATMRWTGVCSPTVSNPDYALSAGASLSIKPTMLLSSGGSEADDIELIEKGRIADGSDPTGTVYLVKTSDSARSRPRETAIDQTNAMFQSEINISTPKTDSFQSKNDIIGYQTGLANLPNLGTLHFRPGAYADHLTSYGGAIGDQRGQTLITALMAAGATASYGTVREPCNFPAKFPDPKLMLENYLRGDTILEAYWKSVAMTTEGLFIGEPLARPFPAFDARLEDGIITIKANRHSRAFIEKQLEMHGGGLKYYRLAIYEVQSGKPQLLTALKLNENFKTGDVLGTVMPNKTGLLEVQLGVLLKAE